MSTSRMGIIGICELFLLDKDGNLKDHRIAYNKVTTAGDQYYAKMGIAGVNPAAPAAPTKASGMKLGTGTTAASKSGAGAAIVTYITGSNNVFDGSYPLSQVYGTDQGWDAVYQTTWAAGDSTNAAITECTIVNDQTNNTDGSTAANTYSRVTFTAIDKSGTDILIANWTHRFLGA